MKNKNIFLFAAWIVVCITISFNLSQVNAQTTITLGAGSTVSIGTNSPVFAQLKSKHSQVVYTAAEINAAGWSGTAGSIENVGFYISSSPATALVNFSIKMKMTSAADVAAWDGTGLTTVYSSASYSPAAGGFDLLTLSTPFSWDGTSNLLVDVCFGLNAIATATGQVRTYPGPTSGTRGVSNNAVSQCSSVTGGSAQPTKPQVQLQITPVNCIPTYNYICSSGDFINNFYTAGGVSNISNLNSGCNGQSNNYIFYSAMSVSQTQGAAFVVNMQAGTSWDEGFGVWVDWNSNGSFADAGDFVYASPAAGSQVFSSSITIPTSASVGLHRMRVRCQYAAVIAANQSCTNLSFGETEDYNLNVLPMQPCSGTPATTATLTSDTAACVGSPFTLSLQNPPQYTGIIFQWRSSTNGTNYTNIAGATNVTLTTTESASTWYRCKIICANSGQSVNSSPVHVSIQPSYFCNYCIPGASTYNCVYTWISNVTLNSLSNTSTCTAPYILYPASGNTTTTLVPTFQYPITFSVANYSGYFSVWIDLNHDGVLDSSEELISNFMVGPPTTFGNFTATTNLSIPLTAMQGLTRMRVRQDYFYTITGPCTNLYEGETEDYNITIAPQPSCFISSLQVLNSATSSATIDWSCSGCTGWYHVEYGLSPTNYGSSNNIVINNAVAPLLLNGLLADTGYTVFLVHHCGGGNNSPVYQINFSTLIAGDSPCDPIPVSVPSVSGTSNTYGPYNTANFTDQIGEPAPPATGCTTQGGWCNSTVSNSAWFSFTVPSTGNYAFQTPSFDTQLALWTTTNCNDSSQYTLIDANDDDPAYSPHGGLLYSSYIGPVLLASGQTYFLQLDPYSSPGAMTTLILYNSPLPAITCNVSPVQFCPGSNLNVNYSAFGIFNSGNIFTAQLSSAVGSFASPVSIGSVTSTTSGSIPCILPLSVSGTDYRIRVISSNPAVNGSDNGSNLSLSCAVPNLIGTGSITSSSAILQWAAVPCAIGYNLRYKGSAGQWIGANTTDTTWSLTGLTPNTHYKWKVRSKCSSNPDVYSFYSSEIPFVTTLKMSGISNEENSFTLFPNPTQNQLTLSFSVDEWPGFVIIQNTLGEVMLSERISSQQQAVDVSLLVSGVYFVVVKTGSGTMMKKFVKE